MEAEPLAQARDESRIAEAVDVDPGDRTLAQARQCLVERGDLLQLGLGAVEGRDVDRRHLGRLARHQGAGRRARLDAGSASPLGKQGSSPLLPRLATHARFMLGEPPRYVKTASLC